MRARAKKAIALLDRWERRSREDEIAAATDSLRGALKELHLMASSQRRPEHDAADKVLEQAKEQIHLLLTALDVIVALPADEAAS